MLPIIYINNTQTCTCLLWVLSSRMILETTKDAIATLKNIDFAMNQQLTVDVTKPSKLKNDYQVFIISDRQNKFKGIIEVTEPKKNLIQIMKKRKVTSLTIVINEHITHLQDNEPICIEVVAFSIPQEKKRQQQTATKSKSACKYEPRLEKVQVKLEADSQLQQVHLLQKVIQQNLATTNKQSQQKHLKVDCKSDEQQKLKMEQVGKTQSIIDLYEQFYNWQIVARVIDVSFREFMSKMGKPTKILSLQLIDQNGYMITGCYFGHFAVSHQSTIKNGKIYKISKGKVTQDKYNKKKREKQSKFTLMFTKDTKFELMHDSQISINIPHCTNNWIRLSQISQFFNTEQEYNFIGILVQIQPEREIDRQDKKIIMQTLKIGDPITKIVYEVVNWNNQIKVNPNLFEKSVLLKKFKVTKFKDQITLNSTFKADIVPHNFFASHQGKNDLVTKGVESKTIKEISQQLHDRNRNIAIVNQTECWIKQIGFDQKWFYDACPNPRCKRACTSYNTVSRCEHCLFEYSQCSKKFILKVKVIDLTGSMWVTAFDQSACVLLKEKPIEQLFPMSNKELCEYAQSMYCYQQYKMQITSKMDQLGQMKHIINGKPVKINVTQSIKGNLKAIQAIGENLNIL